MNIRWMRNSFIYLLIAVALIAIVFTMFSEPLGGSREIPVSQVISMSASGDVDVIEIDGCLPVVSLFQVVMEVADGFIKFDPVVRTATFASNGSIVYTIQ